MTDTTASNDVLNFAEENKPKLSSTLSVLTILTFIGCALDLYSTIKTYISGADNLRKLEDAQSKLENAPAWARKFAGPEVLEITRKTVENRLPILILALVGITLCVYGAIEMRNLKKQGYMLWLAGELLPVVGTIVFVGIGFFQTLFALVLIFPLIFIILYTTQRKYLLY